MQRRKKKEVFSTADRTGEMVSPCSNGGTRPEQLQPNGVGRGETRALSKVRLYSRNSMVLGDFGGVGSSAKKKKCTKEKNLQPALCVGIYVCTASVGRVLDTQCQRRR